MEEVFCKCGCKQIANYGKWAFGHWNRGRDSWNKNKKCKPLSEEHKRKIRLSSLGRKHSEEYKIRMSILNKGKIISNKTRAKISNANKGRHLTDEQKLKISLKSLGKKFSEEHKRKISEGLKGNPNLSHKKNNHPFWKKFGKDSANYGYRHKEESKKKISVGNLGKENKKNRCKWFSVNGIKCQGTWEKRFVEACFKWNIPVKRNEKRFFFEDNRGKFSYCPDFVINNQIYEVKGWVGPSSVRRFNAISKLPIKFIFEKENHSNKDLFLLLILLPKKQLDYHYKYIRKQINIPLQEFYQLFEEEKNDKISDEKYVMPPKRIPLLT